VRTLDEVKNQLGFHRATTETAVQHSHVRSTLIETAEDLWDVVPDGPEKTTAMRHLQQAGMFCNLAIALQSPVDPAPAVASPANS
jgi:hypothetical protein